MALFQDRSRRSRARVCGLRQIFTEPLEARLLLSGDALVNFDFEQPQSLAELTTDGWLVSSNVLDDQDGIDDLRTINGALELTDDDDTTANRFAHTANYNFGPLRNGRLNISAGTGGTYQGNSNHVISVTTGGNPIAKITIRNNSSGLLETASGNVPFGDYSWKNQFRNYVMEWSVDPDGQNGLITIKFQKANGSFVTAAQQQFLTNGVPDAVALSDGWGTPANAILRIDSLQVIANPYSGPFALDFSQDQNLSQLTADGWQVSNNVLDDQDGIDDFRTINGALELTDDDGTTANRFAHIANYNFGPLRNGRLNISAGTGGSYQGNSNHTISLTAAGNPMARITIRNNSSGLLETASGNVPFGDYSWKNQFRNYVMEWSVDPDGQNGLITIKFQKANGSFVTAAQQQFLTNGVPDAVALSAGWGTPANAILRIDSLQVIANPYSGPFALDFSQDQNLSQLTADGWQVSNNVLDDQDGIDDFRTINGALELTDDDGTTANRFAHIANYNFGPLRNGRLNISAGTGGSYQGNSNHTISLTAAGNPVAQVLMKNDYSGTLLTGDSAITFGDRSWKNQFCNFVFEWTVGIDGKNGLVNVSIERLNGTVTRLVQRSFLSNGVPDGVQLSAGWSNSVGATLRIASLELTADPFRPAIAPSTYFDVKIGADENDAVSGRINMLNAFSPYVPSFEIVGGTGRTLFDVVTVTDSNLLHFGQLVVAPGAELNQSGVFTLKVRALNDFGTSEIETITINVVTQTAVAQIFDALLEETRVRVANISDATVENWLSKIQNNGTFSDLPATDWSAMAFRLGSLAEAYAFSSVWGGNALLRSRIYDSVIYWSKNTTTEIGPIPSRSLTILQWDWPRQIASVGYFLFHDIESEKQSADPAVSTKAWQVYDAIIAGTESTVTENRFREDHYWGANLGYRLHTMQLRAALMNDYNRPITYVTEFRRGFVPSGAYADVRALMVRSLQPSAGSSSPGLTRDNGFSQHAGSGGNAQLYTFGYAKDWVRDILQASERFNGTPWPLEKAEYDIVADYLLDGIQWQVFKGQGDYFGQGRRSSLARGAANANADEFLSDYLNLLVTTAGPSQLTRYAEAIDARDAWASPPHQTLVGNRALWNHDFMLQRGEDFYVSTKMNSSRSSGNEAGNGNNRNHYFMGDGATLIMRTGDEYLNARVGWDWHQLPGTTTESRTDTLPLRNWNGSNTGLNDFAGVASNGETGIAAFVNDRYDENNSKYLYHAINSKKATFYFQEQFVALGSDINRVGPGQNMTVRTTLNQVEWRSDVVYDIGEGIQTLPLENWETQSLTFSSPAWFHQDGIGYVILPVNGQTVNAFLQTRLTTNNWHSLDVKNAIDDIQSVNMFQLAVDHGINPSDEQYQYVVIPNVSAAEMPSLVAQMNVQIVANTKTVQAVQDLSDNVTQIVFYEPTALTLPDGLSVSSDQPALIILTRPEGELEVTVADPLHSTTLDHLTLTVTEHLQGQGVTWDESQGISTIVIELSNEVMLTGQSVTARFTVINDQSGFMAGHNRNTNTPLQHEVQQILFDTVTNHKVWTAQSETQSLAAEARLLATQGSSSPPGSVGKDKTNNKRSRGHSAPSDSVHRNLACTTSATDHSIFNDVPFETSDWLNNI